MNIMGIICEYNPFHKGHEYQLNTHKHELNIDAVVCLMSGNFVQRGAPAVYDKWTRAKHAVLCGADLVLELPVVYAAQSAKRFAFGAVSLLDELQCINYLSFGSECGNLNYLKDCAEIVFSEKFEKQTADEMKNGLSYPAARSVIMQKFYSNKYAELISNPNNILALEYINALSVLKSKITPVTLERNFNFKSASFIREKMLKYEDFSCYIPEKIVADKPYYSTDAFDQIVSFNLRREKASTLSKIADVAEGLDNRFIKLAKTAYGADEISNAVKTKRYTKTRIDRIIVNSLLGITDADTELPPQYARVLAFNDRGTEIINKINKSSKIPVITKTADAKSDNPDFLRMLEKDILATDIYSLLTEQKKSGLDYTTSPIYIKRMGH